MSVKKILLYFFFIVVIACSFKQEKKSYSKISLEKVKEISVTEPNVNSIKFLSCNNKYICFFDEITQLIRIFNFKGEQVTKFGKNGNGPGEFKRIEELVIADSSVYCVDKGQKKNHSIFTEWRSYKGTKKAK